MKLSCDICGRKFEDLKESIETNSFGKTGLMCSPDYYGCLQNRRSIGFYWIKISKGDEWTIGHYDDEKYFPWNIIGLDCGLQENQIFKIGNLIEKPKK